MHHQSRGYDSDPEQYGMGDSALHEDRGYDDEDQYDERDLSPPMADGNNENFKVAIRVRPPVPRELEGPRPFANVVRFGTDHKSITLCEHLETEEGRGGVYSTQSFSFDHVYDPSAKQRDVYGRSAMSAVASTLEGYNATLIAYGQTGTGKTFTMEGFTSEEQRGIIPRATEDVFSYIQSCRQRKMKFLVRASYLQIYNEVISDLLKPLNKNLGIRQTKQRGVYVDGLSEWVVRSPNEIYGLMERGCSLRATGSTKMSELSSRSHALFIIIVEIMEGDESHPQSFKIGKLNIVDLAGSEKVRQTGVTGQRLEETKKINWSLAELGNVISALTDSVRKDKHIPYRNSKLTNLLKDSLGGNCKTTLIACISPALDAYQESLSTLKFANRAKNIQNDATVNEDLDQRAMLRKYEREVKRLKSLLAERENGTVSYRDLSLVNELEERSRQAEAEREAAMAELELRSRKLEEENESKRALEERYSQLQQKLAADEAKVDDWSQKMEELDRERQVIDEDKAQVDRYKQLLLKQRDIMLNLTTRLNERDENILRLQEEIDAYDAHVQMLEDTMECAAPTLSTKLEAEEYLSSIRRTGAGRSGGADVAQFQSEADPNHFLTAEEKLVEVLMLKGRSTAAAHADAWERSDSRKELEVLLKERIEASARHLADAQLATVTRELDAARAKLQASEEHRRTLEYSLELGQLSSPDGSAPAEKLQRYLDRELSVVKAPMEVRVQDLTRELEVERSQRRQLMKELDKIKFEAQHVRDILQKHQASGGGGGGSSSPNNSASSASTADQLYLAVTQIEENIIDELLGSMGASPTFDKGGSFSRHVDPSSTGGMNVVSSPKDVQRIAALEKQLELAGLERAQLQESLSSTDATLKQQTDEIRQLRNSVATHVKDRRALKSILQSRIRGKLDNISGMIVAPGGQYEKDKLLTEVNNLTSLVNASVTAMEQDS